ncbi:MAG: VanZ family protein [Janthinobacterium lividum]
MPREDADKPWRASASPLARQGLAWWVGLVVYGSLYPLSGWTDIGVGPFAWLLAPVPRWVTLFDIWTNVLGYLPLGALVVLAVYPVLRGYRAVMLALLTGALLSGTMEAIQTYLPTRVASNLDLASNALGALVGAVLAVPFTSALLDRGALRRLRFEWFERHAGRGIALALLWPFAQMYPQPFLFGIGDWPSRLWAMVDPSLRDPALAALGRVPGLVALPATLAGLADSMVWESFITLLGVIGGGLLVSLPMRANAPRVRIVLGLLAFALVLKTGVNGLQSGSRASSGDPLDWLTGGAGTGLAVGALLLIGAVRLPHAARAMLAFAALSLSLLLINLLPLNPYWAGVQQGWRAGQYEHLNDLAQWLAAVWPYVALAWLLGSAENALLARRARRRARRHASSVTPPSRPPSL